MRRPQAIAELSARTSFTLLDSNTLIFHPEDPEHRDALNNRGLPVAERRQLVLALRPQITAFYQAWLDLLERPGLHITDGLLDLELSAWRFIGGQPGRYARRYKGHRLPRGDLVADHDIRAIRSLKNRVLQKLHDHSRINATLKKRAPGLRALINEHLLSRPIWQRGFSEAGLSFLDLDLISNALAAASLAPTAVISSDRALQENLKGLALYLRDPSWLKEPESADKAKALSSLRLTRLRFGGLQKGELVAEAL